MIYEVSIDEHNRCYGCDYLALKKPTDWTGNCVCPDRKINDRARHLTDRKCKFKKQVKK